MANEMKLAYEFVRQGIWDEDDFIAFVLDIGLNFMGKNLSILVMPLLLLNFPKIESHHRCTYRWCTLCLRCPSVGSSPFGTGHLGCRTYRRAQTTKNFGQSFFLSMFKRVNPMQ